MRIVFLDIDGVLLSGKSLETSRNAPLLKEFEQHYDLRKVGKRFEFDKKCVQNVIRIVDETGALLVVSSSWRKFFPETILTIMENHGIKKSFFHKDHLCPYKITSKKTHEIRFWLNHHEDDIDDYIILDDDLIFARDSEYFSHLIQTEFENGLTNNEVSIILERWED